MNSILGSLMKVLLQRFGEAGLELPNEATEKERLAFIFQALDQVAILPLETFHPMISAAQDVVNRWESGDLADAVRNLALALPAEPSRSQQSVYSSK